MFPVAEVSLLVFVMLRLLPGDVVDVLLSGSNQQADSVSKQELRTAGQSHVERGERAAGCRHRDCFSWGGEIHGCLVTRTLCRAP